MKNNFEEAVIDFLSCPWPDGWRETNRDDDRQHVLMLVDTLSILITSKDIDDIVEENDI